MQNKKIKTEIIMLPVPAELFLEAGMFEGDPIVVDSKEQVTVIFKGGLKSVQPLTE